MIKEHEAGRGPQKTTDLLKTIMWTRVAWESMVTSQIIYNCWVKSTCIKKEEEDTAEDSSTEDVARLETLIAKLPLENPLPINKFLDPEEEAVKDGVEDIFTAVVERYTITDPVEDDLSSDEEDDTEDISITRAIKAIEDLRLWKLQKGTSQNMRALDHIKMEIECYKSTAATQSTLDRYFTVE